jgi:hypothetical protein
MLDVFRMIGGIDIRLATRCGESSLEVAVRAIRQKWSHAVFENGTTGERHADFAQIPFGNIEDVFVYRDTNAAEVWETEGAIPAAFNTMIHIVPDDDTLTLVVDERDAEMNEIIAAIESGLSDACVEEPLP